MNELRLKIKRARLSNINFEGRHFIPEDSLFETMTESTIKASLQSLESLDIGLHDRPVLTNNILAGARKCFAVLILIDCAAAIPNFFRHDALQTSCPDDRLPYSSEALQLIFEEDQTSLSVADFLEKQWEVTIPIIRENMIFRKLDTKVILPFLGKREVDKGSMGTACEIELHPQCHRLPLASQKIVRKQFTGARNNDIAFEREVKNLALLSHLKHRNIVRLYCSYIYRQEYNLVFAVADGGTLETLLDTQDDAKKLQSSQFLLAVADLASAIDAMHNFTSQALDLNASGCHHDLAPRNILVQGDTLLLADFGLSTFHDATEDSLTIFKEVRGSYVAPECQTLHENGVTTERIGRASDIWSFGCIIAEVLTYILRGAEGVAQFREQRKVDVTPEITWFRFHQGTNTPSSGVLRWLSLLQEDREIFSLRMVGLIRRMLSMIPAQRPRSSDVLAVLQGISILSLAACVLQDLDKVCNTQSVDWLLGRMRFQSWMFAVNQLLDTISQEGHEIRNFDFAAIVTALKETQRILDNINEAPKGDVHRQLPLMRFQYERLIEGLPRQYRLAAKEQLKIMVLSHDSDMAETLSGAVRDEGDEDIGVLLAVKHLTSLNETGQLTDQSHLMLDEKHITIKEDIGVHNLATLDHTSETVLVEWLRYREEWAVERRRQELICRLTSVAGLLHSESTTQIPGSLQCQGIFHDPSHRAFGFVYRFPLPHTKPITLHTLLGLPNSRPPLEHRFRLAFDIYRCVYTFHQVGWLHRNLHSGNIVFFVQDEENIVESINDPRLLGFAGSRENQLASFTNGADRNSQFRNYQHPAYLAHQDRFQKEFDYYSVGMILLEIGLWSTLSNITDSERFRGITDHKYTREVLNHRVSKLDIAMGTRYMEATRACLLGDDAGDLHNGNGAGHRWFKGMALDNIPLFD